MGSKTKAIEDRYRKEIMRREEEHEKRSTENIQGIGNRKKRITDKRKP